MSFKKDLFHKALREDEFVEGADILLKQCGCLHPDETVVIVCDTQTCSIGHLLQERAKTMTSANVALLEIKPFTMHGEEPPQEVAQKMEEADLCLGVTAKSMAHTKARQNLTAKGGRYLSLPDYSLDLLADPSLRADFRKKASLVRQVATLFTEGAFLKVSSKKGTDITMNIKDRVGNGCPGFVDASGSLGSPPDIEANVSPIETSAEGRIVCDGSIPYPTIRLLQTPVTLEVKQGQVVKIEGEKEVCSQLNQLFDRAGSSKATVLAECGIGLNDRAQLKGIMLVDEGTLGTIHFGFGSNTTVGGYNDVGFHLDFVLREPSLEVDSQILLKDGSLCL